MLQMLSETNREATIERLSHAPGSHAWALQDLQRWPERAAFHFVENPYAYLLRSGHPGAQQSLTYVFGGESEAADALVDMLPSGPWLVRETPATFGKKILNRVPAAKVFEEVRMELTADTFRPAKEDPRVRRLKVDDAVTLAELYGAPVRAADRFIPWIEGALLLGLFEENRLQSIASTFVQLPEVWEIVSVLTRKEARGRGYAAAVTSALIKAALQSTSLVTLTVLTDNPPAHRLYNNLGFSAREERVWIDNGTGAIP